MVAAISAGLSRMTVPPPPVRARLAPAGLVFLAITSVGWGLNWPVMKQILTEWPPMSARGWTGIVGGLLLAALALAKGQSLRVPRNLWPRLLLLSFLNVSVWMTLMGLALLYLPASEAAVIAYTMPVWASLLAWLLLGERMSWTRVLALLMAFAGIAALMGGNGVDASREKMPGIAMVLVGAFAFALGTVAAKRLPLPLPLIAGSALQVSIGCLPVALAGLLFEQPQIAALTALGWWLMAYMTLMQFCIAYVCWFAALERLPASVAAIGTLAVPVIGVVASAIALQEPLGWGQVAALLFTLAGVVLATRS
jgi:drug/metabolite transporter (DMT)-like permease